MLMFCVLLSCEDIFICSCISSYFSMYVLSMCSICAFLLLFSCFAITISFSFISSSIRRLNGILFMVSLLYQYSTTYCTKSLVSFWYYLSIDNSVPLWYYNVVPRWYQINKPRGKGKNRRKEKLWQTQTQR